MLPRKKAAKLASSTFIVANERDRLKLQHEDANAKLCSTTTKKKRALQDLTNMESRHKMKASSADGWLAKQTSSNFIVADERDKLALQLKDANARIKAAEAETNDFQPSIFTRHDLIGKLWTRLYRIYVAANLEI